MGSDTLRHAPPNMCLKGSSQTLTITIAFHPDISRIGEQYRHVKKEYEQCFRISRNFPLFEEISAEQKPLRRPLIDQFISRTPLIMSKQGTSWHLQKTNGGTRLSDVNNNDINSLYLDQQMLERRYFICLAARIVLCIHCTDGVTHQALDYDLLGVSDNLARVRTLIANIAPLKTPVLVRGESGTGKELVAQALHKNGRSTCPKMVCVNIGAIPTELITTELFGNTKGAFTGATNKVGLFQLANNSSLFLDEIGEASSEVQVALLRALETGVIKALGASSEQAVNVRIIAATDANLESLISQESFRMPLLQRLSGLVIEILPLRKRPEDIGIVLTKFIYDALVSSKQIDKLVNTTNFNHCYWAWFYAQCCTLPWLGNVRQIKNVATQLSIALLEHPNIASFDWYAFVEKIPTDMPGPQGPNIHVNHEKPEDDTRHKETIKRKPREITDHEILRELQRNNWEIKQTADCLGISRAALYIRVDSHPEIKRAGDLSAIVLSRAYCESAGNIDTMVQHLKVSKPALRRRLHEIGLHYSS